MHAVDEAPLSTALNRFWLPRMSLGACLRAVMVRDTRGLELNGAQRWNHFPATPLCSISWWFSGDCEMLVPGTPPRLDSPTRTLRARIVFGGPHSLPSASWNPGPVHGMMAMVQPDALHLLTGLRPSEWLNRLVDVREVFPADWTRACEAVLDAPDDETRVRQLEDFMDPLWQARRPRLALNAQRGQDWAHGLLLRAATSAVGRSLRQVERRVKEWTGQPMRELQGLGRAEAAFFEAMAAHIDGRLNWADVAAQSGYADQSHLSRVTRRITGFAPEELRRRIAEDEGFWIYRMWQ